ncbi:DUF4270 domain-containing protein [Pontimicrobium aquaticum]|uniref:DUF4270 domain-containing protein n=1 Tax=Pontimicrobium aquaticum TaxID=2565367 RepID=A0A4U0F127_9FLAO|nr:DUF4270 domain-containing protein [Pontimicrobium aquaticum]TJY38117.1 DUF4270 domain-containing protein [Pontimicrobium aquaticum]
MKKNKNLISNLALLVIIVSVFAACERDFSNIDSDVVNSENTTHFDADVVTYPIVAYNKKITPFNSDRLSSNIIGYYSDPVYGSYSANFVTQLSPSLFNPTFGENVKLDSAVLNVPYYSRVTGTNEDGGSDYALDSVYVDTPIKLSIYQNNYFLREFDPNSELNQSQKYYSNGALSQTVQINPADLEGELIYSEDFTPSDKQIVLETVNEQGEPDSTLIAPALRIHIQDSLHHTYWQQLLFDKEGEPELSNRNNFLNYFRGLYFKAEATSGSGTMAMLNFNSSEANLTIYYTSDRDNTDEDNDGIPDYADVDSNGDNVNDNGTDTDGDGINDTHDVDQTEGSDLNNNGIDDNLDSNKEEYVMNFYQNLINLIDNNLIAIPDGDENVGDEKLYLKGGEGYMAVIDLFNGMVEGEDGNPQDAFENFKELFRDEVDEEIIPKRLINEAYLEFYVDQTTVQGNEPDRVYLYDLTNNTPLLDYYIDQTVSGTNVNAKINHLSPLERVDDEPDGEGIKYKVRITEHLKNIFINDSTNVKLGLVVTPNVGAVTTKQLLDTSHEDVKAIPIGTLLSYKGTVLYGNNTTNEAKKAKLTIYYTEPKN